MTPDPTAHLREALALYQQGRLSEAEAILAPLVRADARGADARRGLGLVLHAKGDLAGAEREYRAVAALRPDDGLIWLNLARLLVQGDRISEAADAYVLALRKRPGHEGALEEAVPLLAELGRTADLLLITAASPGRWRLERVRALAALDRSDEAILEAQAGHSGDPALLADLGALLHRDRRFEEAEPALRASLDAGLRNASLWTLLGKCQSALGRPRAAAESFGAALDIDPDYDLALYDAAQALWMRTGDAEATLAPLRARRDRAPDELAAWRPLMRATLFTQGAEAALEVALAAERALPSRPERLIDVARVAADAGQAELALDRATQARALMGDTDIVLNVLTMARLAVGDVAGAVESAGRLRRLKPDDQLTVALEATAWRLAGDPRFEALYDYGRLVRSATIAVPSGWSSLEAFLADLSDRLRSLIVHDHPPFDQSTRAAGQTVRDLLGLGDPVIDALAVEIGRLVDDYIAAIPETARALAARRAGGWRFNGAWAVLQKAGGRHVPHVHPAGWLSSAFYVETPVKALDDDRGGWIEFGQPGVPTSPPLEAQWAVRPEPGTLVLFPSYMWHGTRPFAGDERRLTFAFDVVPASNRPRGLQG